MHRHPSRNESRISLHEYAVSIGRIATMALEADGVFIYVGIPPVDQRRLERAYLGGMSTSERLLPSLDFEQEGIEVVKQVAQEMGRDEDVATVPLYYEAYSSVMNSGLPGGYETADDGIHPNESGHRYIADRVWNVIWPMIQNSRMEQN